jgi:hypothetical protein
MRLCIECGKSFSDPKWECPFCHYEIRRLDGHLAFAPELAAASEGFEPDYFAGLARLEAATASVSDSFLLRDGAFVGCTRLGKGHWRSVDSQNLG